MNPEIVLLCAAMALFLQFGWRYVLTYRLTDEDVRAVLFGVMPVSVRRYRYITEVRTNSFFDGDFFTLAWSVPNRLTARGVVIFSEGSIIWGAVYYTPDDPEGFARELRRRVFQQTGRLPLGS